MASDSSAAYDSAAEIQNPNPNPNSSDKLLILGGGDANVLEARLISSLTLSDDDEDELEQEEEEATSLIEANVLDARGGESDRNVIAQATVPAEERVACSLAGANVLDANAVVRGESDRNVWRANSANALDASAVVRGESDRNVVAPASEEREVWRVNSEDVLEAADVRGAREESNRNGIAEATVLDANILDARGGSDRNLMAEARFPAEEDREVWRVNSANVLDSNNVLEAREESDRAEARLLANVLEVNELVGEESDRSVMAEARVPAEGREANSGGGEVRRVNSANVVEAPDVVEAANVLDVSGSVGQGSDRNGMREARIEVEGRGIGSGGGGVWRVNSEVEVDGPESPSSSGYAGERGTSSASTGEIGEEDEICEVRDSSEFVNGVVHHSPAVWTPGKKYGDEDDASMSWRKRKKHFFILSHSGKPIYSRYGDEHKLAGFSATLQAIISFVENGGDRVKLVRAGKHQVVFLVKGPIYLVCISCTEEPFESLRGQLELLYGQMILILTKSVNRCFEKNPKFDMTPLLGGTDVVFSSLIHSFNWNPATFLHAYTCLPLAYPTRQAAGAVLQDVADSGVLFAILMCKHKVVSLVGAQKASLHPDDMLLLSNFVMSSDSFRTSESFSPICLPRYNPMAFLYAYVHYLDANTYLMLLTTSSDAFYHLKECRLRIEAVLLKSNVLSEVQRSILDGGMHVEDVPADPSSRTGSASPHLGQLSPDRVREPYTGLGGPCGLWHFMYRSIYLDQYVSSEFSPPVNTHQQQKRLYRAYQKIYASMHDKGFGPHKTQFRRDENYVLLCWVTQDFELYAAFDPLADKAQAIKTCNRVCQWVKDVENEIFLLGASPFSW